MKILMISADPNVLKQGSDAAQRINEYRALADDVRVIVIAGSYNIGGFCRAWREGNRVLNAWKNGEGLITSQDPFERGLLACLLAWRFGVPFELQIHTDFLSKWFWRESVKNKIRTALARFLLPRATTIRVVSKRIKCSLIERHIVSEKVIVILPIFIGITCNSNQLSQKNVTFFIFLMVSRLTKEKNIPLALRAFAKIHNEYPHTRLIIVGSGSEERKLKSLAISYQLPVTFVGWQNDLESYWREADCYLLTSNYEGYGRTAVDALLHGVPVVMTDVGVAGGLVKDKENGLIVPVGDEQALVEAMREAMHRRFVVFSPSLIARHEYLARMKAHWERALRQFRAPRVVYLVPELNPDAGTHFYYLGGFIKKIAERMRVVVVEEKRRRFFLLPRLIGLRARGFRDVYVHYSFYGALMSIIVAKLFGGRMFYWNCGMPWLYEKERGWFEERLFRFILRNAILVTGTEGMAEQYRQRYQLQKDRMRVMPNWIDLFAYRDLPSQEKARKKLGLPLDKKIVLFAHRLSKRKGAHRIAAMAEALRDVPDMFFVIVGEGPEAEDQKAKIEDQNLAERIRFEGSVPARRVPLYMRAADVFFMPSDEEGFPHVLLEAMAAGTPFAASDVGGVAEIIPEEMRQFLCPPDDLMCFAENIKYFLSHQNTIAKRLSAFVKRYDIEKVAEKFIMLYK